eukprot:TRINITY_DN654_c3_g1_i2.p1 TRINITY_DN654_c3_g1~~TRINITY_DN654_c3_g1_i2.p1  ORF type:complete len:1033 (+),score=229.67 TRINITY_DN654_c3_g1_i2:810-3908(+)
MTASSRMSFGTPADLQFLHQLAAAQGDEARVVELVRAAEAVLRPGGQALSDVYGAAVDAYGYRNDTEDLEFRNLCVKRLDLLCRSNPADAREFHNRLRTYGAGRADARLYEARAAMEARLGDATKAEKMLQEGLRVGAAPAQTLQAALRQLRGDRDEEEAPPPAAAAAEPASASDATPAALDALGASTLACDAGGRSLLFSPAHLEQLQAPRENRGTPTASPGVNPDRSAGSRCLGLPPPLPLASKAAASTSVVASGSGAADGRAVVSDSPSSALSTSSSAASTGSGTTTGQSQPRRGLRILGLGSPMRRLSGGSNTESGSDADDSEEAKAEPEVEEAQDDEIDDDDQVSEDMPFNQARFMGVPCASNLFIPLSPIREVDTPAKTRSSYGQATPIATPARSLLTLHEDTPQTATRWSFGQTTPIAASKTRTLGTLQEATPQSKSRLSYGQSTPITASSTRALTTLQEVTPQSKTRSSYGQTTPIAAQGTKVAAALQEFTPQAEKVVSQAGSDATPQTKVDAMPQSEIRSLASDMQCPLDLHGPALHWQKPSQAEAVHSEARHPPELSQPGQPPQQQQQQQQPPQHQQQQVPANSGNVASVGYPATPGEQAGKVLLVNGVPYAKLGVIGRGGSSKVYHVRGPNGESLALKRVDAESQKQMEAFQNEVTLLRQLRHHERVIQVMDAEVDKEARRILIVMERADCDMNKYLHVEAKNLGLEQIQSLWRQMLSAVEVIHNERIVHSDLKPGNFVLVNGRVKVIDFGIARRISNDTTHISRDGGIGTLSYMAPEMLKQGSMKIGRASDIWSLGIILYQMVYSHVPFPDLIPVRRVVALTDPGTVIEFPAQHRLAHHAKETCDHLADVLSRCLQREPRKRPSLRELLGHPFLSTKEVVSRKAVSSTVNAVMAAVAKALEGLGDGSGVPAVDAGSWSVLCDEVWTSLCERSAQEEEGAGDKAATGRDKAAADFAPSAAALEPLQEHVRRIRRQMVFKGGDEDVVKAKPFRPQGPRVSLSAALGKENIEPWKSCDPRDAR